MPDTVRILANPGGGRGRVTRELARLRAIAQRLGLPLELSADTADLRARARRAADEGVERLLVAGGDGTLHHALQGLVGTDCAMGVLPLGSGNDLAGSLGIPADLEAAVRLGLESPTRRIDLGRVGERYYGGVAGVGFDAEVNRYANERVKRIRGPLIYPYATFCVLSGFRAPRMRIVHDAGVFEGPAMFAVVANSPRYGGGMQIAPAARLDSGSLELVIVREVSKPALLRVFPRVFNGSHVTHPAVVILSTKRAEISLDREMWVFGDGEPMSAAGKQAAVFEIVPGALTVIGPNPTSAAAASAPAGMETL